jgi:hypothetical protein
MTFFRWSLCASSQNTTRMSVLALSCESFPSAKCLSCALLTSQIKVVRPLNKIISSNFFYSQHMRGIEKKLGKINNLISISSRQRKIKPLAKTSFLLVIRYCAIVFCLIKFLHGSNNKRNFFLSRNIKGLGLL